MSASIALNVKHKRKHRQAGNRQAGNKQAGNRQQASRQAGKQHQEGDWAGPETQVIYFILWRIKADRLSFWGISFLLLLFDLEMISLHWMSP